MVRGSLLLALVLGSHVSFAQEWITEKSGDLVFLSDGSVMQVHPWNRLDSNLWLPGDQLNLYDGYGPLRYDYQGWNVSDGSKADLRQISPGPLYPTRYNHPAYRPYRRRSWR